MDTTNTKPFAIKVWRVAVQDTKDWKKWYHSSTFKTFEDVVAMMKPWLEANPGRVIKFYQTIVWA